MMKRLSSRIKSVITLCLSIFFIFSSACSNNNSTQSGKYTFIKDSETNYVIVLPETTKGSEVSAATFIADVLLKSTGCTIEIKNEPQYVATSSDKIISIGETKAYEQTGLEIDREALKGDGFAIKSVGDDIYIIGGDSAYSYIYSAYDLLRVFVDYEAYDEDEIYYSFKNDVSFDDIDINEAPDIRYRNMFNTDIDTPNDMVLQYQILRLHNLTWSSYGNGHSIFKFLPPETYYKDHPEWYVSTKKDWGHVCYSNEELIAELCKNVILHIESQSDQTTHVIVAQNDGDDWCKCTNCTASFEKYGTHSAVMLKAINRVADAVKEYFPGRDLTIATHAYWPTKKPPVKEVNGEIVPFDEEVICRDNVAIQLAPVYADRMYPMYHQMNYEFGVEFKQWSIISKNLLLYDYNTNFGSYIIPLMADFSIVQDNYRFYTECGVEASHVLGSWNSKATGFMAYKNYMTLKLMWDSNCDVAKLTKNFFNQYYKDAAEPLMKYVEEYRQWFIYTRNKYPSVHASAYMYWDTLGKDAFPVNLINRWDSYFDEAKQSIEYLKDVDMDMYQKLYDRIDLETLTVDYIRVAFYDDLYSETELLNLRLAFKDKIKKHDIARPQELSTQSFDDIFKLWGIL